MTIEGEVVGDVVTGAIVAHTVDGIGSAAGAREEHRGNCRNCGAVLTGAYCAACGQAAHIHRSLSSIGHDILHGVFHFEGRIWRTIPELFFHPGRLTRRYIDGERAKFVSPMALYLFTVFLMFAVFALTGGPLPHGGGAPINEKTILDGSATPGNWKSGMATALVEVDAEIAQIEAKLKSPDLTPAQRAKLEEDLSDQKSAREGITAMASGDLGKLSSIGRENRAKEGKSGQLGFSTGWAALDAKLAAGLEDIEGNPRLLFYKLKSSGYKYSWALIPLSLPFMWLLFFWRRDVHMYDHAIFVMYSITFIMQLMIVLSLFAVARLSAAIWGWAFLLIPVHMYKQLRGTYGLSRFGAFVRLFFMQIICAIVLTVFSVLLLMLGVLG